MWVKGDHKCVTIAGKWKLGQQFEYIIISRCEIIDDHHKNES